MKQIKVGPLGIKAEVEQAMRLNDNYHLVTEDCSCDYCTNYIFTTGGD